MPNESRPPPGSHQGGYAGFLNPLIWIAWAVATLHLVGWAAYFTFLSVAFTGYSLHAHVRPGWADYAASAAVGAIPLVLCIAMAFVGVWLWRRTRFRSIGLCVIAAEVLLALYFLANPVGVISLIDLLR